jgi:hypothetical protein
LQVRQCQWLDRSGDKLCIGLWLRCWWCIYVR